MHNKNKMNDMISKMIESWQSETGLFSPDILRPGLLSHDSLRPGFFSPEILNLPHKKTTRID